MYYHPAEIVSGPDWTQAFERTILPDIQEEVLARECVPGRQPFAQRVLRGRLLGTFDWNDQRRSREQTKTTPPDRLS